MRLLMRFIAALGLALGVLNVGPADARRVALVIGNADYKIGPLQNPVNDAAAVAAVFERQLKFDKVILRTNLGAEAFRAALRELAGEASGAEIGVVYFAGHGTEVRGKNYLIPVDATLAKASALSLEAIPLDAVLEQLDGVSKLRLVIIDACRNNIFQLAGATRSFTRGLIRMEPDGNTLVAYAAKEGTTADDGKGRHSPYTTALLRHLATPGLEIQFLFRKVRSDVLTATGGTQQPAEYHSLGDKELFLLPRASSAPGTGLSPPPLSEAASEWARVDKTSMVELETFRRRHPASPEAEYALARLRELRNADGRKKPDEKKIAVIAPPAATPLKAIEPAVEVFSPLRAAVPLNPAEERAIKPGSTFKECDECPELVMVPAGSFMMGSRAREKDGSKKERPQHKVAITRPFAAGRFEVTRGEFATFIRESGRPIGDMCDTFEGGQWQYRAGRSFLNPGFAQDDRHPAVCVSWEDATAYTAWLSRRTGKHYRLLTEAEWEYVARAGSATRYHFGDNDRDLCTYGNVADLTANWSRVAACRDGHVNTAPVGSYLPNVFGLYDVHGNAWEWVQDCWNETYSGAPSDGSARTNGDCSRRVIRGGSWGATPPDVRSAYREGFASRGLHTGGFRIARVLTP